MILDDMLKILEEKENSEIIAYSIKNKKYTYKTLYTYILNIYKYLKENNKEKRPVIIYGHKEIYMKASFIACSFAGITYVPIDSSMPTERTETIIEEVNPFCIIGNIKYKEYKTMNEKKIKEIMEKEHKNNNKETDKITIGMKKEDIYYILFTSGTTGKPKGVKITYENINSCINWLNKITKIKNGIILNQVIFSFDVSCMDLYLSVLTKSTQYITQDININNFLEVFKELKSSDATHIVATPSYIELLLTDKSFNELLLPNLKQIIFCGEKLTSKTIRRIYERFNNIEVINTYGPTECTVAVTSIKINKEEIPEEIPIGYPKENCEIIIVDEQLNEIKEGEEGEILILGESVGAGYLNTKKEHTFIEYKNQKGYLTGDIGYKKNGIVYYTDRKDRQIKLNGYRIELNDIENNLNEIEYIEKSKVLAIKNEEKINKKIIAYIQLKELEETQKTKQIEIIKKINSKLKEKLPNYMIPYIKVIREMPINNNGKIDTKKLITL